MTITDIIRARTIAALTDGQKASIIECAAIYSRLGHHGGALSAKVAQAYASVCPTTIDALLIDRGMVGE